MEAQVNFTPLLVVSVLAVAVPVLLHRIPRVAVPIIVGEIVAGIVVGPYGLDLIRGFNPYLDFLKLFGFTYLMFLSGLEIDFGILTRGSVRRGETGVRAWATAPLGMAILSFTITLGVALAFSAWLARAGLAANVFVMALVLSTTSLGVVAPVLKEAGLLRAALGQYILVAAVVGDLATVTLVSVYVILHTQGLTFEVLFVLALLMATVLVYRLVRASQRHLPMEELLEDLSHATAQIDTRGALALAVVFIALSQGLGVEVILGAFLAGTIISLLTAEEGSALRPKLNALGYGFFIPIFFIMVGVDFDLGALVRSRGGWLLVPALVVMAFVVKYAAALIYRLVLPWRQVFALGTLTSSRLSLIIAVAAIGVEIGAISETTDAAIIVVAVVTVIVAPVGFSRLLPPAVERWRRVVIAGSAPQARLLAQRLRQHGETVTVLTRNAHLSEEIRRMGIDVVLVERHGREDDLERAGIGEAWAFASMLADPEDTLRLSRLAKQRYGIDNVIAYVQNPQVAESLKRDGVRVVDPSSSVVIMLEAMLRHPHAFALLAELDISSHVAEVELANWNLDGRLLREVPLPGDALVLALAREGEIIVPRGFTRLQRGDVLTLVGSRDAVDDAVSFLGP